MEVEDMKDNECIYLKIVKDFEGLSAGEVAKAWNDYARKKGRGDFLIVHHIGKIDIPIGD
jgi:hypothetical protein